MGNMILSCDIKSALDYNGSVRDCWINGITLAVTTATLVLCTWRARDFASRFVWAASYFWLPFTLVLLSLQLLADCGTENVGVSAVWSAHAGFVFLGSRRLPALWAAGGFTVVFATLLTVALWAGVCVYYAVVEDALTTVAHVVAYVVGALGLLVFEALHQIRSQDWMAVAGTNHGSRMDARLSAARGTNSRSSYQPIR